MMMLLSWLLLLATPDADRLDCRGAAVTPCPPGMTGPACDLACERDDCDYALYCHGDGATYGLAGFGARLFALAPADPDWLVRLRVLRFAIEHPADLGLAPDLRPGDLGLATSAVTRVDGGALRLLRLRQYYRDYPLFGADATVTLVTDRVGVIGLRGSVIDGRDDYAFADAPAGRDVAEASVLGHAAARTGIAAEALRAVKLRLVAFSRTRAIGWAAAVFHGPARVADIVVAADPQAVLLPLLHHTDPSGAGLDDAWAIAVRAEDLASDLYSAPIDTTVYATRPGGPLTGSLADGAVQLADRQVVLIDADGAVTRAEALAGPIYRQIGDSFDAYPGTREFGFQGSYHLLRSFYALTDAIMHGRWDSAMPLLGRESAVPASEFSPRLLAAADPAANLCGEASWCVSSAWGGAVDEPSEALRHPSSVAPYEVVGAMYLKGDSYSPSVLPHEFGHFVDLFAAPGLFYEGLVCMPCWADCYPGTTDESLPLSETFASLMALWFYRSLYPAAGRADSCDTLNHLSLGENRNPHNDACRPTGSEFSRFLDDDDPACPNNDADYPDFCDRPQAVDIDFEEGTGLCAREIGYEMDSFFQAFWELLHGETCGVEAPYACTPLPVLSAAPADDAIGRALLYAAQVGTATYAGFADDVAAYIACNHGEAAYLELNEVLCHHAIRPCDAPAPTLCEFCGDGVRSGREACDGEDLDGHTCADLGFAAGTLACGADCQFAVEGCLSSGTDSETTGVTTTGAEPAPTSEAPEPETTAAPGAWGVFIDPATAGGEAAEDGCACATTTGAPWWLGALALAWRRRRARR